MAQRGEAVLQFSTGLGAVLCGLVVASRVTGPARWWRLLLVAGLCGFLIGQLLWWLGDGHGLPVRLVAYVCAPTFAMAAVLVLLRSSGGVAALRRAQPRYALVTTAIDGVVAACSFFVLVAMGEFGVGESLASLPRSGEPLIEFSYAVLELVVVVSAVVIALMYDPERPDRANYLFLAGGFVVVASAERVEAYLDSVQVAGARWAGIGYVVGLLLIAFAMRDVTGAPSQARPTDITREATGLDWAQLLLPYLGFLGVAVLFAFHVLIGEQLTPPVVWVMVVMVLLVAVRQVIAMRAQHLLAQRLISAQRGLAHQVLHDPLTGLPNRLLFAQRLDDAMRRRDFVLIFVDLDDFKEVNDRFGHAAGDELLCAVGERLSRCVTADDTLARIGGDEFAILVVGERDRPEAVADRLRVALRDPFPVHGSSVRVRASMGLVRPPGDGVPQTSDDLLRQADVSMYAGKRIGKDTAVVYQPTSGVHAEFPAALREAAGGIPTGFSLAYQPVVRLPDRVPVALEALARWIAPNGILISPETFVASAESAGLGATLDALVLDLACREVMAAGVDVDIHINIGAPRLGNPAFEEHVARAIDRYRIGPGRLVVEVTETVPIVDLADAAAQIERFNQMGVRIALDDFGAGYNSLTYLQALPVSMVKLDRSLAVGAHPGRDLALYRSVIGLCTDLGLAVVAEGIESTMQADTVYAAGCRLGQGHLFGQAVPMADIGRLWDRQRRPDGESGQPTQFAGGRTDGPRLTWD